MFTLSMIILGIHFLLLTILCLFGLHRLSMVIRWFLYGKKQVQEPEKLKELPAITVQIPLYNEQFVAARVIDSIVKLNYPSDKLQLQIVDDSTDDTCLIVAEKVAYYRQQGINIDHVQRDNRIGYKAGALKQAMNSASGEFIAIFDADFVPPENILLDTVNHFSDEKVAMVQFRWEHLNRNNSRLTRTQAIMLDAHFALEQTVRQASGKLLNFNGTAGIWRVEAIIDAGHWSADTLTEDLDLSYRAQLRGWKMCYLNNVSCPGEIPADMNAFKSQQHRWAKGGIEVMLKLLKKVWRAPIKLSTKIESSFHLGNNLAYLLMLIDTAIFLIPSIFIRDYYNIEYIWWLDFPLFLASSGGHLTYLLFSQYALGNSMKEALKLAPNLMLLGIQLSINNSRAAIEALRGQASEFVRTPKSGELENKEYKQQLAKSQQSYKANVPKGAYLELALACACALALSWGIKQGFWFMTPFFVFLVAGYGIASLHSFKAAARV